MRLLHLKNAEVEGNILNRETETASPRGRVIRQDGTLRSEYKSA